ncbi:hypothetical protein [Variovorax sp. PAMC 28711]|uniref:hypothetical protein n=1 Tax=Variovorax sp. PAMC 28711 TaxID=1795631 RepID=UPI00078D1BFE|nr:hypothetical protein [Variovorax sp. PAMC 28711]AMM26214.1 hypothetical protein AX767_19065 [Variovorax sp. PAMC 28711]
MNKLFAALVAGLFAAGAYAQAPASTVMVPSASAHTVAHAKHHAVKKHHKAVRHARHRKVAHRM